MFLKYEMIYWVINTLFHYSVHGVLNWECDSGSSEEIHAVFDHETIVIIEEESPDTHGPAAGGGLEWDDVDEVVPNPHGKVFDETGGGGLNHKGSHDDSGSEGLFLIFVHFIN